MTQKDKVKELVGRGLHSYHTKALQQMDRIEKKNKEQNHKISILTNELDNDYLTKTEEGSVISLEHSKEGMVYLDELQGNTLVNYCTDGSKEITLNGDIDLEGTFVTTTEGVDNGKVDVMCEGNTLVNYFDRTTSIISKNTQYTVNGRYQTKTINTFPTKVGDKVYFRTKFSVDELNTTSEIPRVNVLFKGGFRQYLKSFVDCEIGKVEEVSVVREHPQNLVDQPHMVLEFGMYSEMPEDVEVSGTVCKYTVYDYISYNLTQLFGIGNEPTKEWCDENLPYIEGMKSVGQDDENGHKIEILSRNKNLFNKNLYTFEDNKFIDDIGEHSPLENYMAMNEFMEIEPNETYVSKNINHIAQYDENKNFISRVPTWHNPVFTSNSRCKYIRLQLEKNENTNIDEVQLELGNTQTSYTEGKLNKKEILLNEPLRSLPNGVKDRFVKIGGKLFIERNCGEIIVDHNSNITTPPIGSNWYKLSASGDVKENIVTFSIYKPNNCKNTWGNGTNNTMAISDKFTIYPSTDVSAFYDGEKIVFDSGDFKIGINKSKLISQDVDGFKQWLQFKPIKVAYQLITPIYEPLEVEPTLNTYNDVTHISNNSIIPCNMKIQNSGYNAIIKPSTLYTVALDTNKSGTIGMNLGGTKSTTTNNVATITTPATLADDSLRLYGKGIKGSKVRLLEGDKTNWIPSHFEGMKSSFEDKLQDDGTYKMEILSNNKNLLDLDKLLNVDNYLKGTYSSIRIPLKPNTKYYFKFNFKPNNIHRWIGIFSEPLGFNGMFKKSFVWNENIDGMKQGTFITDNSTEYYLSVYQPSVSYNDNNWYKELFTNVYEDFIISQVDDNYMEGKSNKIQFSSIDPLRGVENVRDRFVFKDGQLMIERSLNKVRLTRNHVRHFSSGSDGYMSANYCAILLNLNDEYPSKRGMGMELLCNQLPSTKNDIWTGTVHREGISGVSDIWDFSIKLSNTKTGLTLNDKDNTGRVLDAFKEYLDNNVLEVIYHMKEPTYEEISYELQKIILEGYENGTLFFDTNIPPTSTVTYAGETPIVKSVRLNKTEVLNNTNDINDNIIPYLMDMDYRVVCLQLATEEIEGGVSMSRLFGGAYDMLKRDILSKRLTKEEYGYRLTDYFNAGKLTEEEVRELEDLR